MKTSQDDERRPLIPNHRDNSVIILTKEGDISSEDTSSDEAGSRDGGWGWVVVCASFLCVAVVDGTCYTSGIFINPLITSLGSDRGSVTLAGSLLTGMYSCCGLGVARLVMRFGPRKVCMTGALLSYAGLTAASYSKDLPQLMIGYSIITGIGFGMLYIPGVVAAAPYFSKRLSLATSIALCGSGAGTFALAPLSQYLLDNYGWWWTFRVQSGLALFCCLCGATMATPRDEFNQTEDKCQESGENKDQTIEKSTISKSSKLLSFLLCGMGTTTIAATTKVNSSNRNNSKNLTLPPIKEVIFREPEKHSLITKFFVFLLGQEMALSDFFGSFVILVVADWMAFTAIYIAYAHLPALAVSVGFSTDQAALIISSCGVGNTLGRMGAGWIADLHWILPRNFKLLSILISTLPLFLFIWTNSYVMFLLLSILFGSASGSMVGVTPPHLVQLLGLGLLTPAFGLITVFRGLAAIMGPPLAALLMERFQAPWLTVLAAGAFMAAGAALSVLGNWHNQRRVRSRRRSLYSIID